MSLGQGVDKLPLSRIPKEWSPEWFANWIREVLAYADTRNATAGPGIAISGQPNDTALISASTDVLQLLLQSYVLATPSTFLPNERILTGQAGYITITDGGANSPITVGIDPGGLPFDVLQALDSYSVLGNPTSPPASGVPIIAGSNDTLLRRVSDLVDFGQITLPMAPDNLWTYAKIQDVSATSRVLGRITSGAGDIEELTGTQTTTLLDLFTDALKGLVPPPVTPVGNYLRDDGTWQPAAGGGGGYPEALGYSGMF